jgi:hypothetical protein
MGERTLRPGDAATRGLRALLARGPLDDETAQAWADAAILDR